MSELADKIRTIGVKKVSPPTDMKDRILARDLDAYKRLRHQGLQPRHVDGSAELEARGTTQMEIEYGRILSKDQIKQAQEGILMAREIREESE